MEYGYFPGCSLTSTAKEYDETVRAMVKSFGVDLKEIQDWNCCGATPAGAVSEEASLALPWRNLALAEGQELTQVLSPCPACHSHMCSSHEVADDAQIAKRMEELTELSYSGKIELRHLLDFLIEEIGIEQIKEKVTKPLLGIKAACYYGCLTRLHGAKVDDRERPIKIQQVVEACGGTAVSFSHATDCCGASLVLSKTGTVLRLSNEILAAAKRAGANCVVVVCSVCQGNLDMRQKAIEKAYSVEYDLPVIYLSQLVLMSQGASPKELGFSKHFVKPDALWEKAFVADDTPKKKRKKKNRGRITH